MHNTEDIIQEASSLPVEERVIVVDSLLRTLNMPDPGIDKEWAVVAKRRLTELRSGRVKPAPADQVLLESESGSAEVDFHPEAETEFFEAVEYYESCSTGLGVRPEQTAPRRKIAKEVVP